MSREQIDKVKHCGCEYGLFIMPFAYDTYFLNRIKLTTTILCTCCGKKVTRITKKGAVKAWNRKIAKSK
ncbi:MAG: hypothetical protein J6S14_12855 [Clostridia bacterium]|nr:hypothetical protein [Clostridia bacterium]